MAGFGLVGSIENFKLLRAIYLFFKLWSVCNKKLHNIKVRTMNFSLKNKFFKYKLYQKLEFFTASNSCCQKVRQKFSVIITNTCVFAVFRTKSELKCQNVLFFFSYYQKALFWLLRFSNAFFDVLFYDSIWRCTKLQLNRLKYTYDCVRVEFTCEPTLVLLILCNILKYVTQ